MFKKIWNDAVWSKVIAATILAALSIIPIFLDWYLVKDILLRSLAVPYWSILLSVLCLSVIAFLCRRSKYSSRGKIAKIEEDFLVLLARNNLTDFQVPFFAKNLSIDNAIAKFYAKHLADIGYLECDRISGFEHFRLTSKGREYLINRGLV